MSHSLAIRHDAATHGRRCRPEVSLIVTTYQKPRHLSLALASVALQKMADDAMEVIVVDDGSTDETFEIVERFAESVEWPVKLTTHSHLGYQVARCRNEGVEVSSAPYIVLVDGDCIIERDFISQHLKRRKAGVAMFGDTHRLDENVSARIDASVVRSGEYRSWVSPTECERLKHADRRARWSNLLRRPRKPHLIGCNVGIWRSDYEQVNGFDENFEGWGQEDDDLGYRLRQAKVRIKSIMRWTPIYHVWHPRHETWTADWREGRNVSYMFREDRATRCVNGLIKLDEPNERQNFTVRLFEPSDEPHVLPFPRNRAERPILPSRRMVA